MVDAFVQDGYVEETGDAEPQCCEQWEEERPWYLSRKERPGCDK